jgi:hypothetical protein
VADGFFGLVLGACISGLIFVIVGMYKSPEQERISNVQDMLNEQKGSVVIYIGHSPDVPIFRYASTGTPSDPGHLLENKHQGQVYTFHDRETALKALQAVEKGVGEIIADDMKRSTKK